ncbi:MAG: putative drug exporter of the superfamily [Solirubrobacterales bacterium]|jgi:RND superfamily putative drug exporter|nr:putative drug exporter of the superfamily [Solirubrobacterales bacterium]
MRRFASWTTSHRKTVIVGWILTLLVAGMLAGSAGDAFTEDFSLPASDSKEALDLLEEKFPAQSGEAAQVVFEADDGVESPSVEKKMEAVFSKLADFPHVSEVASPYEKGDGTASISDDGKIAYATVQFDVINSDIDKDKTKEMVVVAQDASGDGLQVEMGGQPIQEALEEEGEGGSFKIGLLAAIVVLLLTFGSVVAMGLPIVTALLALGVGISVITLGTHVFPTANFAPFLALMIGLGVGVDYALFILTRFRSGLDEGMEPRDATIKAVDTAGRAVLFAGITVIISLMGMFLLGLSFLYGVAMAAAVAVLFTMIAALTLLPALLTIVGRRVDRLRLPGFRRKRPEAEGTWWYRWSRKIQRRPVLSALLSGGLLILLCVPVLSLRLGTNDAGNDPPGKTTREAYDLLAEGFGPGFNGPLVIAAALPEKGDDSGVVQLRTALEADQGIAETTPIVLNPAKNTAVFQAYPTTSPQSEKTTELLDRIRDEAIPPIETKTGTQIHVGGINAIFEDFGNAIAGKLPLFIGVVVLLSALLLMMVFRSVWVPLKAMVMNLLSIGAAFGLVVAVFQWGWGASLIGVEDSGPIISFFPIFLFAIIFGLSMDYEVFLMSRIHEEWEHRKDATEAVTRGLALTGRVITAAAAIMVTVFASFMLGEDRIIKLFGLGLASAVFIDAVIIRSVLVPAVMQLLGARAWRFPGWLDRLLPRLHVEPAEGDPSPTGEAAIVAASGDSDG